MKRPGYKTLETTLNNAKGEAFNSLMNSVRSDRLDIDFARELSNIHAWLCSKYARYIGNSLRTSTQQEIYSEAFNENYLK